MHYLVGHPPSPHPWYFQICISILIIFGSFEMGCQNCPFIMVIIIIYNNY